MYDVRFSNPRRDKTARPSLKLTQPPIHWVPALFPSGFKGWGVNCTTHFHLAARLKMSGNVFMFLLYLNRVHRGKFTFSFYLINARNNIFEQRSLYLLL